MSRISFFSKFENSKQILLENTRELDDTRKKIASGKKLEKPSDNPPDTVRLLRFQNQEDDIEQFKSNITQGKNNLENSEAVLKQVNNVVQRARELAVRGANDSLDTSARSNIADELNERLDELVDLANTKVGGEFLFGGNEVSGDVGSLFETRENGQGEIVEVTYNGDANLSDVEVSDGQTVASNLAGNRVFQSTNHEVTGGKTFGSKAQVDSNSLDQQGDISSTSGFIQLDDTKIHYDTAEDSLADVAQRINDKGIDVEAVIQGASGTEYDPGSVAAGDAGYQLKLKSRTPHEMFLKDVDRDPSGTPDRVEGLLNDLQILGDGNNRAPEPRGEQNFPNPYHQSSTIEGKSVFDAMMDARESLQASPDADPAASFQKTLQDGSLAQLTTRPQDRPAQAGAEQAIEDFERSITNLNISRSIGGARTNRIESAQSRVEDLEVTTTELISQLQDADLAESVTDLNRQRSVQQASLRIASQISNLTLANFI